MPLFVESQEESEHSNGCQERGVAFGFHDPISVHWPLAHFSQTEVQLISSSGIDKVGSVRVNFIRVVQKVSSVLVKRNGE